MPVIKAEQGGSVKLEPGTYVVTVDSIAEDYIKNPQFGDGHTLKFKFTVEDTVDEKGEQVYLSASASYKLSPKSKLWGWVEAFGFELEVGQEFDTDELVGMSCQALVSRTKKDDGSEWSEISSLFPLGKQHNAPRPVAKASGEPDYDAFWKQVTAMGMTKSDVISHLPNKNLLDMQDISGTQLVEILEKMSAQQ